MWENDTEAGISGCSMDDMRSFSARETQWLLRLDGIELAPFWRRAFAFVLDWFVIGILTLLLTGLGVLTLVKVREHHGHPAPERIHFDLRPEDFRLESSDVDLMAEVNNAWTHVVVDIAVPILYFGLLTWRGEGRSPGKRVFGIRVVSLVHPRLTFWHSTERALGYAAAALEFGFGFVQFFIHPYRRTVQDRIAETIVVREGAYLALERESGDGHGASDHGRLPH